MAMQIHESAEDYLEKILMLKEANGTVRSIDIANAMGFSKPSISIAMKHLRENGYITMDKENHIELTEAGREIAVRIYDRHLTLTSFFEKLGISKEIAEKDACKIEHDLSPETFDAISTHLRLL